eukprot:symbB.v1.2.028299.t1/scaffold2985.1/size65860/3
MTELKVAPKIEDPRTSAMSKIWLAVVVAGGVFYVVLKERVLRKLEDDGGRIVPNWVAKILREALGCYSKLVGVREVSTGGEGLACDQSRKYMLVWHPHGFITWVPFFIAGRYALDAQPTGAHWFPMVAPVLFRIPIFSEMLIILGARRVDKKVVEKMLARGDSIALQPGGVKEQALSDDQQEQAFFPARLGFIRMAIKYGVDLLPIYFFGENQLYKRVRGLEWISNLVNKTTGLLFETTKHNVRFKYERAFQSKPCMFAIHCSSPVPGWTDKWIPERVKVEARKHRRKQTDAALDRIASVRGVTGATVATAMMAEDLVSVDVPDELRDLSTRQPSGGSVARADGPHRLGNDGDTRQDHPHQYHFDVEAAGKAAGIEDYMGASHWWVKLRRMASDPEVKLWTRDCCSEIYGRRLYILLGNTSNIEKAVDCVELEAQNGQQLQTICPGTGEYLFVEARPGAWDAEKVAVLMLPEVRVLSRD